MSKQLFEIMRAEEMATLYDSTFTKKEATTTGVNLTRAALEAGEVDKMHFGANLARLNEVISSALSTFRESIIDTEKVTALGVEFSPVNGGESLNYKDDPIWVTLKADLDARQELLNLAQKQEVLDTYGNEAPKVSTTPRKSSITIKF